MNLQGRIHPQDEDGVALFVAIAVVGLVGLIMLTLVSLAIREGRQTAGNRARASAVTTAEGAVDLALAQVQDNPIANVPCGASTVTNTQSAPESLAVTTTVSFLDAAGSLVAGGPLPGTSSTATCPPPAATVATQALIRAVAVTTPAGGGQTARRVVESLVALKPKFTNDFDKAIFGNAGVTLGQRANVNGSNVVANDADIYTNGDFSCANNETFHGSVYAQGSIKLDQTCTIANKAWAKTGASVSSGTVSGDLLVSQGTASITGGTVSGKVRALAVTPASYCTTNSGKCVTGTGAAADPPYQMFPQLNADPATISTYQSHGFNPVHRDDCTGSTNENPGVWIASQAATVGKTLLLTKCRLSFAPNVNTISVKNDLAIFADGGISLSQSMTWQSTDSILKALYFVQPSDFATRIGGSCSDYTIGGGNPGIDLTQRVTMAATVHELVYSPCDVNKRNNAVLYGQVYAGGVASLSQNTDVTYSPLDVFGAIATRYVISYKQDVLYEREAN